MNTQYAKVIKLLNCISLVNHPFIATTLLLKSVQLHDAGTAKYLESFVFTNRGLVASLDLSRVFLYINIKRDNIKMDKQAIQNVDWYFGLIPSMLITALLCCLSAL